MSDTHPPSHAGDADLAHELSPGPISWMARNPVTANLLAAAFLVGGLLMGLRVKQEVFPEFEVDMVAIAVPYPGASPSEVEQGILLAVEEAIRGLDGIDRVLGAANEGVGTVMVELLAGTNRNKALTDIKNAVDRIVNFPEDAERPTVSLASNRREVINLVVYGDVEERVLRSLAEKARDELLTKEKVTYVELSGVRPLEISVEVPRGTLRTYDLTLEQIAGQIARAAVELPAGAVKTAAGEVLPRIAERRDLGAEFEDITVLSTPTGAAVKLSDIATIRDGFADTDVSARYFGKPAAMVKVFRVADQTPIEVADAVKAYVEDLREELPPGVGVAVWRDWSEIYRDRIDLLLRNARLGLILVFVTLGLFLEMRLAFWVTLGIPISFLGALLFMPALDISVNMISLFAFIVTLGMVVDDAIVIGENVYDLRRKGVPALRAAIVGARQMAGPVTFAILTTVAAFMPLLFVPGTMGKLFGVIPAIVILVLLISLVESLFVLPSHLAHMKPPRRAGLRAWLHGKQQKFSRGLEWFIRRAYAPVLAASLRYRYLTLALGLAVLIATFGFIKGGHIEVTFMPKVDSDLVTASAVLPYGAPVPDTERVQERLLAAAKEVLAEHGGDRITRGLYTQLGTPIAGGGPAASVAAQGGSHLTGVQVYMVPSDQRDLTAVQFAREWRERAGEIPGLESLTFRYTAGPSGGSSVDVQLTHKDLETLERAAADVAAALSSFEGVRDIDDGFEAGKPQLNLTIRPEARSLGLTATDIGRQIRNAFFGAEALRQQRGRDEVRMYVRLPEEERTSEHDVEELMLRTPQGGELPLFRAADVERGHAYTRIQRTDARRTVNVTADVVEGVANPIKVRQALEAQALPDIIRRYPGLTYSFEGEQREMRKAMGALGTGFLFALFLIYGLLAIPFKSYVQPLVVMSAIPFGIIGAVVGHLVMGFDLSLISMMGIIALSGVVVNDSLILVDTANAGCRESGLSPMKAIYHAGVRRFRPILLTSLTTFFGLAPMIFEPSVQARFLIPMALSLGYGILFSTFVVLMLVPSLYLFVEDAKRLFGVGPKEEPHERARRLGNDSGTDGSGTDDSGPLLTPAPTPQT